MSREKYLYVQVLLPEICAMEAADKTKSEIAKHSGLRDKLSQNNFLRMNATKAKTQAGVLTRRKDSPRKDG